MNLFFTFSVPTKIFFAENSLKEIYHELNLLKVNKVILITDEGLAKSEIIEKAKGFLKDKLGVIYGKILSDSGVHFVEEATQIAKDNNCDGVVSVGGGSSLDTGKAVAVLLKMGGELKNYAGAGLLKEKVMPHIAVPTTAGTGAEVTKYAVIKDESTKKKISLCEDFILPDVAILDPTLTLSLPSHLTAATAFDALSHAIEGILSIQQNIFADVLGTFAISQIKDNLPFCLQNPQDLKLRSNLLLASCAAGITVNHSLAGVVHSIAHTIGAKYNLHHGLLIATVLPECMEFNLDKSTLQKFALISNALGVFDENLETSAKSSIAEICNLRNKVGLNKKLSQLNIPREDLLNLASETILDGTIMTNPKPVFEPKLILSILEKVW